MKQKNEILERLYERYNTPFYMEKDPVAFVHKYTLAQDMEIAGLVASCLAYGGVKQIMASAGTALGRMPKDIRGFIDSASLSDIEKSFEHFKHRFTTGEEMASLLKGTKKIILRHGSLKNAFAKGAKDSCAQTALCRFVDEFGMPERNSLLPHPSKGSACKRLNLFLRWMFRKDSVDPGCWADIAWKEHLMIPLDTHLSKICKNLGFVKRSQSDHKAVLEATGAFRKIVPHDPVRYDFSLMRASMAKDPDLAAILKKHGT